MQCSQMMKAHPQCLGPAASVRDAARCMLEKNIGFLPVCDSSGVVMGTVTDRDLAVRIVANQLPATTPVGAIMTNEIVACRATDDVDQAKRLMAQHRKSRVMCLDAEGRLEGVISLSDFARRGDALATMKAIAAREARAKAPPSRP